MPSYKLDKIKALEFALITFIAGLLQTWVVILILKTTGNQPVIPAIFGDGGFYFFSTSLVCSSLLSLRNHEPLKVGTINSLFSSLAVGSTLLITLVMYTLSFTKTDGVSPFLNHSYLLQSVCLFVSGCYAFYTAVVTGLLGREEND